MRPRRARRRPRSARLGPLVLSLLAASAGSPVIACAQSSSPPAPSAGGRGDAAPSRLAARHRSFLEDDTTYLLSDVERLAFLDLVDDRQRDAFIQGFWLTRDPSPLGFKNEFRVEHQKRVAEADALFGAGRERPGWKTARGRTYILLGPPRDRISYVDDDRLRAVEDWFYAAAREDGEPRFFHVLFYRPQGTDVDALYDPTTDGPERLVAVGDREDEGTSAREPDADRVLDRAAALRVLTAVSPELASVSLSLLPTEPGDLTRGLPTPASGRLVDKLLDLASRRVVDLSYLQALAAGRSGGKAEVSYSQRFPLQAVFHGDFARDALGMGVAHEAVVFPPEALAYRRMGDRVVGALHLAGRVVSADNPSLVVLPIDEQIDVSLSVADYEQLKSHPLAFQSLVPLLPGSYRVHLVARNLVSRGVGVAEGRVEIPAPPAPDAIGLSPLLLIAEAVLTPDVDESRPFFFGKRRVFPLVDEVARGTVEGVFHLAYPASREGEAEPYAVRYTVLDAAGEEILGGFGRLPIDPAIDGGHAPGTVEASLKSLAPGRYTLRVAVTSDAADARPGARALREAAFSVGEPGPFNAPWVYSRKSSVAASAFALTTYTQWRARGDLQAAARALESILDDPQDGAEARLLFADLELARGGQEASAAVEAAVLPLAARGIDAAMRVQALAMVGAARAAKNEHAGALSAFEEAIVQSPRHVRLWNALAASASKIGEKERAREALERSIAINPAQPEIAKELRELKRARR